MAIIIQGILHKKAAITILSDKTRGIMETEFRTKVGYATRR